MLTVRPDFYDDFQCLASRCRHSCCIGWEIDVDADTLAAYQTLEGPLGDELREKIDPGPTPHFRLGEGERARTACAGSSGSWAKTASAISARCIPAFIMSFPTGRKWALASAVRRLRGC